MYSFGCLTDCGLVRPKNEDNACIVKLDSGDVLMMVLDGMGGHNKGEKASSMAMEIIKEEIEKKGIFHSTWSCKRYLIKAIKKANKEVNLLSINNIEYQEMGTTLTLAYIRNDKVILCQIGDSRLYVVEDDVITQVSEDQTYVQFLYKTGKITKDDIKIHPKRHVLMNALGTYPSISVTTKVFNVPSDKLMICSDGLYNMIEDEDIKDILNESGTTENKVERLIKKANDNGGLDNIAVALMEVKE